MEPTQEQNEIIKSKRIRWDLFSTYSFSPFPSLVYVFFSFSPNQAEALKRHGNGLSGSSECCV